MHREPVTIDPQPDGTLKMPPSDRLPLGGCRVEAVLEDRGRRLKVGVWGGGHVVNLRFSNAAEEWSVRPNLVRGNGFEVALSRSRPALALTALDVAWRAAARPLAGIELPAANARARAATTADGLEYFELPWGAAALRRDPNGVIVGVGANADEALSGARLERETIVREAEEYAVSCARLEVSDPLLGSMFAHSLHAALAAVKLDERGRFTGLAAGPGYSLPPRTYYRDAYWTVPALLPVEPQRVAQTIDLLAAGIHSDGEAPSAVITPTQLAGPLRDAIRLHKGTDVADGEYEHDWWRDHFDSPLMFILMLDEYAAFTGDRRPVDDHRDKVEAILQRYRRLAPRGSDLPLKPYNERDWADNVFRSGLVTYDLGLYHGALVAAARLTLKGDPHLREELVARAARVRREATHRLWLDDRGHFLDYANDEFREEHLAIDTLTAIRGGLADEAQAEQMLDAFEQVLQSRNNREQPHGDFGVLCCYPPYGRRADLKAKSAFAYRYHNGADWPYWDGAYAGLLLARRAPGWRYPLLRWWECSLERGWATPVEYFSPPFAPGAPLQAWSAMPAASVMLDGFGVKPPFQPRVPPWGASVLRDVTLGGDAAGGRAGSTRGDLVASDAEVSFEAGPY